ncbi:MAG: diacylglycerol kinase family protein [Firmicutes bacterium]|nr:diacylglycerol kinase family protein [Bacillota bacterium]
MKQSNKKFSLYKSFGFAISGIVYAAKTERNFKIHLAFTTLVIIFCVAFFPKLTAVDIFMLIYAIFAVLCLELVNTAVEALADLYCQNKVDKFDKFAKIAKDCCAGAVLLAAIQAVIIGAIVAVRVIMRING